ncbi:AAA family ATPase [Streptomyces somaliensis DSM 40738]|uniref:AAA family ATPase n=1 Tax=Streptomyces somaliensis (strain ATCC 33201 / DSM 40738 / JCM 12659 / KCTC 9044 / NCTC 11332 / NRRL B-12077 / IP 733) TaxID=1134445 RepID=A0AA44DFR0_STRE0|nr:LuxR family transcriptional regulator [Streptomyces somaliensis]MCQ0021567.1 AAA family ATPase [Streptomyces somaliensis DSM 40738]NKY16063.1 AAA family ATPase [Streptomyces somaliensis DSM 40738]
MRTTPYPSAPRVGRARLIDRLDQTLHTRGRAVLTGPAGIGKTEVARAAAAEAAARGERVLWLAPQPADRDTPGAAAAALVASVPPSVLGGLPGPQRAAVAVLCREAAAPEAGRDPIALRLALARILRTLAGKGPVLLVVDDTRHVDPESADLLRFALQLAPPELRVLAVETPAAYGPDAPHGEAGTDPRQGPHTAVPGAAGPEAAAGGAPAALWVPSEADVLLVPPLQADEIAELLVHHRLASRMAGRIHQASGGNPRLALAVGRSLADARTPVHHAEALPLSGRARDLARRMLAPAPPPVRAALLLAALALRPTTALVRRAGRPTAETELVAAERAGLVSLTEDGAVTFTAGLLPTTLVHDTCWTERSEAHTALARVVDDPVEAVRHRALATDVPDERLAAEVAAAAETARRRGNNALAAELALLAAESTPVHLGRRRIARLADAAGEAARAARADLALRAAADLLARDAGPEDRVRARLAVIDTAGQGLTDLDELYVHAMEDSEGSPALRAAVQLRLAVKHVLADGDLVRSRAAAVESAALAASVGDRHTAAQALTQQARVDRALGSPDAEGTLAEARALERADRPLGVRNAAQILTIRHALFDDRLTEARDAINALLPPVERRGSVEDAIELLHTLAAVESRLGQGAAALQHAHRSLTLTLEAGLSPGPAWYTLALAESAGGSFARAMSYARRSAQASEEEGDHVFLSRALYVLGRVQLITGDVAAALDTLRRVQEGERALRIVDPSVLRWHEELAEVLLAHDAREEAESLLAEVSPVAERLGRTTVLLGCDRARAQCLAAAGRPEEAAGLLAVTAERFAEHGLVLEQGRCLIALARVERRRRRRSAAQQALNAAVAVFERAGAVPWLELVAEGPSRADAVPSGADALSRLTEAEVRLARMVGQGASNQEAAARLYLSVKTVEARLTRIYQKLDVRSRAQLATVINAGPAGLSGAGDGAGGPG